MKSPFLRLVWKEYRSQRNLWIALQTFVVLLGLLFFCMLSPAYDDVTSMLVAVSSGTTFCFTIASIMLLFVGEEDNRTAQWLRHLPVRTSTLFCAKITTTIAGTVLMLLVCSALVLSFHVVSNIVMFGQVRSFGGNMPRLNRDELLNMLVGGVVAIVFGVAWSLQAKKILPAMGWCVASFFGYVIVVSNLWNGAATLRTIPVLAATVIAIGFLMRRWHRGVGRHRSGVGPRPLVDPFMPWRVAVATSWATPGLTRAASRSPLMRRTFSVLLWQQLRTAVPFVIVGTLLIVLTVSLHGAMRDFPWTLILLGIFIVECGLRTFRDDQKKLNGLFWAHRGVSPMLVWTTRHLVWFPVLLLLVGLLLCAEYVAFGDVSQLRVDAMYRPGVSSVSHLLYSIQVPILSHLKSNEVYTGAALRFAFAAASLCGGYVIGHLCALWARQTLLATCAAFLLFWGYEVWLIYLIAMDVTLWLAAFPLTVVMVAWAVMSRRQWSDRRWSIRIGLRRAALVATAALCIWPLYVMGRTLVPAVRLYAVLPSASIYDNSEVMLRAVEWPAQPSQKWQDALQQFADATKKLRTPNFSMQYNVGPQGIELLTLPTHKLDSAVAALDTMLQADLDRLWLPIQYVMPWSESLSGKVSSVLIQEATRSLKSGDVAGCIDHLLEAKRLLNYLARTTARQDGYMDAISWMRIVDQKIHQVVADDQVTTEQLDELANRFPAANRMPPTAVLMMANRQLTWYSLHHQSGPIWERFSAYLKSRKEVIGVVGPDLLRSFVNASWTERKRFLLILDGMTSLLASPENSIQAANEVRRVLSTELDHTFLEYLSSEMGHVATVAFRDTINAEFWAAHNSHRATMLIISAQKHRREHGAFPNRLTDIEEPGLNPTWTVDIRNSNSFSYSPTGFGRDFDILTRHEGANLAMPGAQPILWCSSSPSPSIQKKAPLEDAYSISLEPNRIVYLDTIFGSAYIPASGIATSTEAPVQ